MELLDNLIGEYAATVERKFPNRDYPVNSNAGNELQDMFFELNKITNEDLSPAGIIARDSLLTKISAEKLRGFI